MFQKGELTLFELFAIIVFYAGCVALLIVVHEVGHYLAGLIAGIPAGNMRIRLLRFPQHVDLLDGSDWVSPVGHIDRYTSVLWQYLKTTQRVYGYVAGGLIFETAFTVFVSLVMLAVDLPKMAIAISGLSLFMFLPWAIIDGMSISRGKVTGDLSGLWLLARNPTILLVVVFVIVRMAIISYASE